MASLVYPRRLEGRNVRFLELLPGDEQEPLECCLIEMPVDGCPAYQALSYVWGTAPERETLTCNGQPMQVTISLAQALRKLRPARRVTEKEAQNSNADASEDTQEHISNENVTIRNPTMPVWADAICINQADTNERNAQVQMMGDIYSKATVVVAWLGPDEGGQGRVARTAIEYVADFLGMQQIFTAMSASGILSNLPRQRSLTLEWFESRMEVRGIQDPWHALHILFSLPYWWRIWCTQEIYLAKETSFLFGDTRICGKTIYAFVDWFMQKYHQRVVNRDIVRRGPIALFDTALPKANMMLRHRALNTNHMFRLCAAFQSSLATDLRDKVYGILGMWQPDTKDQPGIKVDYSKPVVEVYTDVVIQSILADKSLLALRVVDFEEDHDFDKNEGFPSWVPRWDKRNPYTIQAPPLDMLSATRYQAEPPDAELARSGVLAVKGIAFDRVVKTSSVIKLAAGSFNHFDETGLRNFLRRLWLEATGVEPNTDFTHQITLAELATTITGGVIQMSSEVHPSEPWMKAGSLDTDIGREFINSFKTFMDPDTYPGDTRAFFRVVAGLPRRVFRTSRGYLGLGRPCMKTGDIITVLHGGNYPFVLRVKSEPSNTDYSLVGDCFVYDIMNQQIYDMMDVEGVEAKTFNLR